MKKLNNIENIKALQESGLSLKTILKFSEKQIKLLSSKLHEDTMSDLTREKADALEDLESSNADLAKINADIETASEKSKQEISNESEEVEDVDNMGNPEWEQVDNGDTKQGLLDGQELEIGEEIMYGGAPSPEASFNNPDAGGFESQGPMDSYGQFDGEGDVGLDEISTPEDSSKYDLFKKYEKNFYGLEDDMKEDTEQIDTGDASKGEYTQTPSQQQAPDGMGDGGDPGSRGMGIESVQNLTKKSILEVAVSKSQKNFYCFVKSCRESGYKDCGTGNKIIDAAKDKKGNSDAHINSMCSTDVSKLPDTTTESRELDNIIMNIVERYENPSFSKENLIKTIKEASVGLDSVGDMDEGLWSNIHAKRKRGERPAKKGEKGYPKTLDIDEQMTEPTPTIAPTKPKTTPGRKPGRKSPYQPKHKPKPKAKSQDVETQMPSWLAFDNIFIKDVDEVTNN
jgi:hypothetical protein|tara:strand:+ start:2109 stop:3476 length:1368 start_codon:yes stop_codon:yes gene_type:complete